jgi:hypothetical protein
LCPGSLDEPGHYQDNQDSPQNGTLTIIDSTFSGNSANEGGGIDNYNGTLTVTALTITASTFSGNFAGDGASTAAGSSF